MRAVVHAAAAVMLLAGLGACSTGTVQRDVNEVHAAVTPVQAACSEAAPLANLAILLPVVGPYIASGVQVLCMAGNVAQAATDPSTAVWLGQQSQMLRDALAKAGFLKV